MHLAQRRAGIDSSMLITGRKTFGDKTVVSITDTRAQRLIYFIRNLLAAFPLKLYRNRSSDTFNTGLNGLKFDEHPLYKDADIIHLHWINGLVSTSNLATLTKPVVWTMRDMWPLTGGCHYSMECDRYKIGCGKCPNLGSSNARDLSRAIMNRKKRLLPKRIHMVGISKWISDCAKTSEIFRNCNVSTISNAIDTDEFRPVDTFSAREILRLPKEKKNCSCRRKIC